MAQAGRYSLLRNITRFGRLLRRLDINVTPAQTLDLIGALKYIDLGRRDDVKHAARVTLINRAEHLPLFDRAFDLFWRAPAAENQAERNPADFSPRRRQTQSLISARQETAGPGPAANSDELFPDRVLAYSAREILRRKDFADLTAAELAEVKRLMRTLVLRLERRPSRRKKPTPHGSRLDMRRTLRRSLRYGGEFLQLARQTPKYRRRPLLVLCDISGSMERYARILLQFIYLISNGLEKVEAFVFSTRLTRLTRQLKSGAVDAAFNRALAAAEDWGGGTRTGDALKTFNYAWARRVLRHGAIVLLISDGWDRGDIDLLGREMQRLQLSCHRLIWLNPLLGSPGYQPLTRGMQAALPYVDDFLPVHNLHSLEQLGRLLERIGERRPLSRLNLPAHFSG